VSIMQPAYLPWPGYLHRILAADVHIVLDHVQFEKNSFTNRNKMRTKEGWCWLTVPVKTRGRFGDLAINTLEIADNPSWQKKHAASLRLHYARAPHFAEHAPFFEQCYARPWTYLADLNRAVTTYLLDAFDIRTPLRYSSTMGLTNRKDELVRDLVLAAGGTVYLSGPLGRNYLRPALFEEAGIQVVYHDYPPPVYPQAYPGFEPGLSAIDLLFNEGENSSAVLRKGGREHGRGGTIIPNP